MKFNWKKALVIWFALLSIAGTANAGFLLEPYGGWDLSVSGKTTDIGFGEDEVKWNNWEVGGRIGWVFNWFALGLDYDWKKPKVKWTIVGVETEQETAISNFGFFLGGYWKNWTFRVKYNFLNSWIAKDDINNGPLAVDEKYESKMGFGADLGWRIISWLALNVEYTYTTYDEFDGAYGVNPELTASDILISVSFPIIFGGGD